MSETRLLRRWRPYWRHRLRSVQSCPILLCRSGSAPDGVPRSPRAIPGAVGCGEGVGGGLVCFQDQDRSCLERGAGVALG